MPLSSTYLSPQPRTLRGRVISAATLVYQTWTDPLTADADGYSVSHAGQSSASTVDMTLGGALCTAGVGISGHSRNVVIVVTHATSVVAMSGTIYGTDIYGKAITEAWSVTATGTTKTFTGKKGFKTVTRITETVAANASANSIIAGQGVVLGLAYDCSVASAVKEIAAGSIVTNGTLVAASTASTDDERGTYAPNTAPDGSNDYTVYYISNSPQASD